MKLAVLFLSRPGEDPLVGIPLTDPMGWCLSSPNFSACTEPVANLANTFLENPTKQATARMTPHCLNIISETAPMDVLPITTATHPVYSVHYIFQKALTVLGYLRGRFLRPGTRKPMDSLVSKTDPAMLVGSRIPTT